MLSLKYENECIEKMEWLESYQMFIHSKQATALNFLFLKTIDCIDKTNEINNLQYTNSKIMMTITIVIDHMIIHNGIDMYNSKLLYWFKQNNLTYIDYRDYFSATKSVTSK